MAHHVTFGDFMAGNLLAGDFLGGYPNLYNIALMIFTVSEHTIEGIGDRGKVNLN